MAVTDGATRSSSTSQVDPGGRESAWESVLNEGISSTGIDPSASFESPDDPAASPPQPEHPGSSEGASPAGSPAASTASATGDDDHPTSRPASSASTSAVAATDPAAPAPETDPLAGAEPFTYPVDGETRTMDGAFRIPGEGLYVPEDKVPQFQLIATQAATLDRQNRELYTKQQELERLSTWQTQRQDGYKTGRLAEHRHRHPHGTGGDRSAARLVARSLATISVLNDVLRDPGQLVDYELVDPTNGDQGSSGDRARRALRATSRPRSRTRSFGPSKVARSHLTTLSAPPAAPAASPEDHAPATIKAILAEHKITNLTDKDRQLVESEFPRYVVRDANGKITGYDPRLIEVIKHTAALRAEQKQVASSAEAAGKFNGGMNRGRVGPRTPQPPAVPTKPQPTEKVGKQAAWDNVLQSALQEIVV
jgi:hypothetical protein